MCLHCKVVEASARIMNSASRFSVFPVRSSVHSAATGQARARRAARARPSARTAASPRASPSGDAGTRTEAQGARMLPERRANASMCAH